MKAVVAIVLIAGLITGNFMYELALDPGSDKSMLMDASHNEISIESDASMQERIGGYAAWGVDLAPADVYIESYDGLRLHAYSVEQHPESGRWAILCHGYGSNGTHMVGSAKPFADMGFNLLLPDARGLGQSEGDYIGMGWHERHDIVRWVEDIISYNPDAQIVLYGISMGGATVMMTAGEPLPDNVRAVVEDCGYSSVWDEFGYQLRQIFGLPEFPILQFASMVTKARAGFTLREADAVRQVANARTPILFIHGDSDTFVPTEMVYAVYEAAPEPKELLVVEGAGHGLSMLVAGDLYWDTIESFIEPYMD